jgi:hypothetical protein
VSDGDENKKFYKIRINGVNKWLEQRITYDDAKEGGNKKLR